MILLINSLFGQLKRGKNIQEEELVNLARMILDDCAPNEDLQWLTFPDLKLCLNMGVKGKLGKILDSVDFNLIYDWLAQYSALRLSAAVGLVKRQRKDEGKGVEMPEDIKKAIAEIEKKVQMKSVSEKARQEPINWDE